MINKDLRDNLIASQGICYLVRPFQAFSKNSHTIKPYPVETIVAIQCFEHVILDCFTNIFAIVDFITFVKRLPLGFSLLSNPQAASETLKMNLICARLFAFVCTLKRRSQSVSPFHQYVPHAEERQAIESIDLEA